MQKEKEKNFVSAVVYLGTDPDAAAPFLEKIGALLGETFEAFEIVCVNDACPETAAAARACFKAHPVKAPVTFVNMSVRQGVELCMNAGIDIAIGDYIFEFDSTLMPYAPSLVLDCYRRVLEGYDIVSAVPAKRGRMTSRLFYRLFNSAAHSIYKLTTDSFHVLSRRAVNRLHAINPCMAYRKAAYAASGLRLSSIEYKPQGKFSAPREYRAAQAADALALYTDAAYRVSFAVAMLLLGFTVFALVYTLVIYLGGSKPIEGWTTTMLLMSAGFFGVFLLLTFVLKYLSLLVELTFKNQKYLVESVEKVQYGDN